MSTANHAKKTTASAGPIPIAGLSPAEAMKPLPSAATRRYGGRTRRRRSATVQRRWRLCGILARSIGYLPGCPRKPGYGSAARKR
jgi:hypothetical protein